MLCPLSAGARRSAQATRCSRCMCTPWSLGQVQKTSRRQELSVSAGSGAATRARRTLSTAALLLQISMRSRGPPHTMLRRRCASRAPSLRCTSPSFCGRSASRASIPNGNLCLYVQRGEVERGEVHGRLGGVVAARLGNWSRSRIRALAITSTLRRCIIIH